MLFRMILKVNLDASFKSTINKEIRVFALCVFSMVILMQTILFLVMAMLRLKIMLKKTCFCKITRSNKLFMTQRLLMMIVIFIIKLKSFCKILALISLVYYRNSILTPRLKPLILTLIVIINHIPRCPVYQSSHPIRTAYYQWKHHLNSPPNIILTTTQEPQNLKGNAFKLT